MVEPGTDNVRMRFEDYSQKVLAAGVDTVMDVVMHREAMTPFEQYSRPPVRALLARLSEKEHVILVVMHHVRRPACACCCRSLIVVPPLLGCLRAT